MRCASFSALRRWGVAFVALFLGWMFPSPSRFFCGSKRTLRTGLVSCRPFRPTFERWSLLVSRNLITERLNIDLAGPNGPFSLSLVEAKLQVRNDSRLGTPFDKLAKVLRKCQKKPHSQIPPQCIEREEQLNCSAVKISNLPPRAMP